MVIIEAMKHNRLQQVDIPKPKDLFKQVGERVADSGKYSGDEYLDPSKSKVQAAAEIAQEVKDLPPSEE